MAHIVNTHEELSGEAAERLLREVCMNTDSIRTQPGCSESWA